MKVNFLKLILVILSLSLIFFVKNTCSAVDQSLNDTFFQNPAELSKTHQLQLMAGDLFIAPAFKFTGQSSSGRGSVTSKVNNNLPYMLGSFRVNDRVVLGINITPSAYGRLEWPINSIVANASTKTYLLYYRAGVLSSYQFSDDLSIGVGLNFELNRHLELDFVVPPMGNQINKASGLNNSADIGLFYKISPRSYLTAAVFSPVQATGTGTSTLNTKVTNNFSLNITEATVAYIGLQHELNDKLFLEEKIYWSGWYLQKNIEFKNSTTGSYAIPTNWKNVWSYQVSTRYATTERIALLGSLIYETNPAPTVTNSIGYPLAASIFVSVGLDIKLRKSLSAQFIYGYGTFIPNAQINNASGDGAIAANIQVAALQFTYKI